MVISDILDHAVRLYGKREAVVCGDLRLTYGQMSARVRGAAAGLLALGLRPGDRIGALLLNCHRYAELYFAADYAGLVLTPLNHRLAADELVFILNHAEASAIVVGPEFASLFAKVAPQLTTLQHVIWSQPSDDGTAGVVYDELIAAYRPLTRPAVEAREHNFAELYYTSGTTGSPKGAMLSQRNVTAAALLNLGQAALSPDDSYLRCAPAFHLADAWANFAVTLSGGRHVFLPQFAPEPVLRAIAVERVTVTLLVPTMINALVNWPNVRDFDTSSLRLVLFGASPMPSDRLRAAMATFGCEFTQWYGMTEAYPAVTAMPGRELGTAESSEVARRFLSCGREVPGVRVRVVNTAGAEVEPGEVGEILIKSDGVMLGYWRNPEATAAALRDGWMHSGDGATVDEDGYLYLVDRIKDMIISGGENIYSTEVEDALYRHPAVLECAVIGIPDDQWGERVHAVVVLRDDHTVTAEQLIDHARSHIARYKCPRSVEFAPALPKTGSGKIQKAALRAPFWSGHERAV